MADTHNKDQPTPSHGVDGLLYEAWGVIANAPSPAWSDNPSVADWREAAERWRDRWHSYLNWAHQDI